MQGMPDSVWELGIHKIPQSRIEALLTNQTVSEVIIDPYLELLLHDVVLKQPPGTADTIHICTDWVIRDQIRKAKHPGSSTGIQPPASAKGRQYWFEDVSQIEI